MNTTVGFGRAERRHSESTPDVPDKDKAVWLDIAIDHETKSTTRFEVKCLDCGPLGYAPKRREAINLCGAHLQEKHPGLPGRIRRDTT